MKKSRFIILSVLSAMALASCSLFNDDDIVVENHFKTKEEASQVVESDVKAGGVAATTTADVPGAMVFKNVEYYNSTEGKKIKNSYTTGTKYAEYNINKGEDYDADPNNNNFDLYIPEGVNKEADQNIVLFIHGGAWISGLKSHVNPYVKMFANKGYISATIEYTLLDADLLDDTKADKTLKNSSLSIFRDLDEIDACIYTMKKCLVELGFTGNLNLVIGGASSGAHLAMLYSYSRGASSPMPIKFIVDAVGPTDIKEDVWKTFKAANQEEYDTMLADGIEYSSINAKKSADKLRALPVSGQGYAWNEYQTMRIANGMCGLPFSLSEVEAAAADENKETVNHSNPVYESIVSDTLSGQDLLSVTHYLKTSAKIPMLCAYAGKDNVVGIGQFANLQKAMEDTSYVKGTDYDYFFFKECGHVDLDKDAAQYEAFTNKIVNWLETK